MCVMGGCASGVALVVFGRSLDQFPWSTCQSDFRHVTGPQTAPAGWYLAWQPPPSVYE